MQCDFSHVRRIAVRTLAVFAALVVIYLGIGLAAYLVPDAPVRHHVEKTLEKGDFLEDYPHAVICENPNLQDSYSLDNYTDALIVNQALHLRVEGWKGIFLLPSPREGLNQCENLSCSISDADAGPNMYYPRYWHGSTFVVRLLLAITSYQDIRYLFYMVSTVLLLWCLYRLWSRVGRGVAIAILFSLFSVNFFVMQFSLQFVWVLLIALSGIIWLTYRQSVAWEQGILLFFVMGSLTGFLDLITVPSLTLALPLVVVVAMRREQDWHRGIAVIVVMAVSWLLGYTLTWLSKWGLATPFTGENVFANAYGQAASWTEGGTNYIVTAIMSCMKYTHWKLVMMFSLFMLLMVVIGFRPKGWKLAVQFGLIMLIPLAYYVVMAHPAAHHAWFNYRALAPSVAALLLSESAIVDSDKLRERFMNIFKKKQV